MTTAVLGEAFIYKFAWTILDLSHNTTLTRPDLPGKNIKDEEVIALGVDHNTTISTSLERRELLCCG